LALEINRVRGMTTLLIATRNNHKIGEIRAILGEHFRYLSLQDFLEAPPVAEDQETFAKNASKKARELAKWLQRLPNVEVRVPGTNAFVLADDSGLEVDALNGAPGVHSARFAALDPAGDSPAGKLENSADITNNAKLLRLLQDVPWEKRTARFRCVLSLVRTKPPSSALAGYLFEGVCEGRIQSQPKGRGGFGYDPLFLPHGYSQTFAELGPEVKNQISHRAQALLKLRNQLGTLGLV
jgi:XTP/dITP diphosphohydrolase